VVNIYTTFFNISDLYIKLTEEFSVFNMNLAIDSYYFPKQNEYVCLCNGEAVDFLWGMTWIFKYYL
jgi:hypothetical protein